MKRLIIPVLLAALSLPVSSEETDNAVTAVSWLKQLSQSLNTLNFSTSFVVVKNNDAEPYHWFHGIHQEGDALEILSQLNGPRRDILKKGSIVSYFDPELPPYSVMSEKLSGPIPVIFSGDVESILNDYSVVLVGKSRVLGRSAQMIRIVPKDASKYGMWLWLDQKNSFLLKLAFISRQGKQLEQIQFTYLDVTDQPAESLQQLYATELPQVVDIPDGYQQQQLSWQVNWLPQGFKQINANRHRIISTKQPVEFQSFSDGLVEISVYVAPSQEQQRPTDYVMDGATVALNQVVNGYDISVVGKIPSQTAKRIADSVSLVR